MTYTQILSALADPTRQQIVQLLRIQPQNVAALAAHLPVSRPAVSQHLKILTVAGLLRITPKGTSRIYQLAPDGIQELQTYLDEMWGSALNSFAQYVEKDNNND